MSKKTVVRTERGWAGHFIAAASCRFRRNTLLEQGKNRIVVSTVGNMYFFGASSPDTIGLNRYYETMVFQAEKCGVYWDADVAQEIAFEGQWGISEPNNDRCANNMHEAVVAEITAAMYNNTVSYM